MPKPIHAVLAGLAVLAAGSIALLAVVLNRPEPVRLMRDAEPAPMPDGWAPYTGEAIGFADAERPAISYLAIADLDGDGLPDVLVCDAAENRIDWIRQAPRGTWTETPVGPAVFAPVRVVPCDVDGDGRMDLAVACRGRLEATDDHTGSVVLLLNRGAGRFDAHVLLSGVLPVTDLRAADLNGDGRVDFIATEAGLDRGALHVIENTGAGGFRASLVANTGPLVAAVAGALGGPGRMEIAVVESADYDRIRIFRRKSPAGYTGEIAWTAPRRDFAASCLELVTPSGEGAARLVLGNGGAFPQSDYPDLKPWHGLQWLVPRAGRLEAQPIARLPGCHAIASEDLDRDGHVDLVAVSTANNALDPAAVAISAFVNASRDEFTPLPLPEPPAGIAAVAVGDVDGNGVPAIVTGAFHPATPSSRAGRVTLWRRH